MTLSTYFVQRTDDDGNNLDLFVRADTALAAVAFWREYYNFGQDDFGQWSEDPDKVWIIDAACVVPGPLPWDSPYAHELKKETYLA